MKNRKAALLLAVLVIFFSFLFSIPSSLGSTEVKSSIDSPTVWNKAGSPYLVKSFIDVNSSLNIEPGVIVKFDYQKGAGISVKGTLDAIGTAENNIVFTSIRDDSFGGDSNLDGEKTVPKAGDWWWITTTPNSHLHLQYSKVLYGSPDRTVMGAVTANSTAEVIVRNSEIKYSGYLALFAYNSQPVIEENIISNNNGGLMVMNQSQIAVTLRRNSIANNNYGIASSNQSYWDRFPRVDARDNWWGDKSGPYFKHRIFGEDNLGGKGNLVTDGVLFNPWLGKDPFFKRKPVVIVPGIGASVNPDLMIGGLLSDNWTMFDHTYDGIIQSFKEMGYEENKDLFICYYDWRKSNNESASSYLKGIIQKANSLNGTSKVNVVAHSMGGLVARSYIQGDNYNNDVDNLFLIGTPNKGSSDVYVAWEGGYIPNNWPSRRVIKSYVNYLSIKNAEFSHYDIIHNFIPSVKELLPVYDYLYPKFSPSDLKSYQEMVERNYFLEDLNQGLDILNQRVKVSVISGSTKETVNKIPTVTSDDPKLWRDGEPDPTDPERDDTQGDGRVLVASSEIQSESKAVLNYDHGDIVSQAEEIIAQKLAEDLDKIYPAPDINNELGFWFASPVDVEISDPEGRVISESSNNIPLAKYASESKPDGFKIVSIPNPVNGTYEINIKGNGDGEYHIGSEYFDYQNGKNDHSSLIIGNIKKGEEKEYVVKYNPESIDNPVTDIKPKDTTPPTITGSITKLPNENGWYDSDVTIHFEATDNESGVDFVTPDITISDEGLSQSVTGIARDKAGNEASFTVSGINIDKTAPEIEISSPEEKAYLNNQILDLSFEIGDNLSTVDKTAVKLDGAPISENKADLALLTLGSHQFEVKASDKAGNEATERIDFKTFATIDSIISNVGHYQDLGNLTSNKEAKFILIKLDEIKKKIGDLEKKKSSNLKINPKEIVEENFEDQINRKIDWLIDYLSTLSEEIITLKTQKLITENLESIKY